MTTAQIDTYIELVSQLGQTTDSTEFASLYKSITGEDLTIDSLNDLLSGSSKVENSTAAESQTDYKTTQEAAINGFAGAVSGTVAAVACAATGGAALPALILWGAVTGGTTMVAIKGVDAATQNNDETALENLLDYASSTDIWEDYFVGAISGATNAISGEFGSSVGKTLTNASKHNVVKIVGDTVDNFIDGASSASLEYVIDCVVDGETVNISDLTDVAITGGMSGTLGSFGSVFSYLHDLQNS